MDEDFDDFDDLLPDGAVPLQGIKILRYIDTDGMTLTDWHLEGDITRHDLAGLLETTKWSMLGEFLADIVRAESDE
jgi:hypothetical protein